MDAIVIGAGVVGCALAQTLSEKGYSVTVLEQDAGVARGISSRNSGVVHAGLYYPPGSWKAETCIRGNHLLTEWCTRYGVPFRKTGKWVLAQASEEPALQALYHNAKESGAPGIELMSKKSLEKECSFLHASEVLFSSTSGIVDVHAFCQSLQLEAERRHASFVFHAKVQSVDLTSAGDFHLHTSRGEIQAPYVFNCAGFGAFSLAQQISGKTVPVYPCRGDYFRLRSRVRIPRLVYPLVDKQAKGLGIHLTLELDGRMRLGPDAYYVEREDDFSEPRSLQEKTQLFLTAAQRYLPSLTLEDLSYETCGIRPKLRSPVETQEKDFFMEEFAPGWFNFLGIESPGLTASLALAEKVSRSL